MKIFLSPSNQVSNVGAYKPYGTNECEECEKIADYARQYLEDYDCEIMVAERSDNISKRTAKAKEWGADVYIPIHTNASSNSSVWGVETFYYSTDEKGKELAVYLLNTIGELIDKKRSAKAKDSLGELVYTDFCTRAYVECDFHSNPARAKWLVENPDKMGNCIAESLVSFFGIPRKDVPKEVKYKVQVGIYDTAEYASEIIKELDKLGFNGIMIEIERY